MPKVLFIQFHLPLLAGLLALCLGSKKLKGNLIALVFLISLIFSFFSFFKNPTGLSINLLPGYRLVLATNTLSRAILLFINLFGLCTALYSQDYEEVADRKLYFSYLAWLIAFANLTCLASDFIIFVFAWGATLALLYALLKLGSGDSANKALAVVGFGDFSLILGVCLYIYSRGTTIMPQGPGLALENPIAWVSFVLMLLGAFAKAGCGPMHTWIPAASEDAPVPVMAILPASLDKLLGIYLLARICVDFFILNNFALGLLLISGSLTILFAVMMALIQHDLRKLLSYHAISQVGYMVLGFGTGTALGVAGGLFHMLNNALYKSGLFLTGGSVAHKRKTFKLEELGGLARFMPVTFIAAIIFSLSISGVPPLNGFASKWLLYQGVIVGFNQTLNPVLKIIYIFALVAAMFGSALTLASFIKFMHAIFLGEEHSKTQGNPGEVSFKMRLAVLIPAFLCILLGIAPGIFLKNVIEPWLSQELYFIGSWNSQAAFLLIISGLLLGLLIYKRAGKSRIREDQLFIGGEKPVSEHAFLATEFYKTIEDVAFVKILYRVIKLEALDLYNILGIILKAISYILFILVDRLFNLLTNLCGYLVLGLSWVFRKFHSGVLDFYLAWSLLGLIVIIFILMGLR